MDIISRPTDPGGRDTDKSNERLRLELHSGLLTPLVKCVAHAPLDFHQPLGNLEAPSCSSIHKTVSKTKFAVQYTLCPFDHVPSILFFNPRHQAPSSVSP